MSNINPVAFEIGPIAVHWYGIIIALAVAVGLFVAKYLGKPFGFEGSMFEDFLFWVLPAALIGARLWYVLFKLPFYIANPEKIIAVWEGGLAIHGAVLAAIAVALVWTRKKQVSFFGFADVAAPALILGQSIGRWANFVNQEAYGVPTDLPWAMYIAGAYRHPTFLYESIWNFLVFVALSLYLRQKPSPGRVFALYLVGYSVGRFFIEGLRTDSLMLGPFRIAQLLSLVFIAVGIILFVLVKKYKDVD